MSGRRQPALHALLLACVLTAPASAGAGSERTLLSESDHKYSQGESVHLYANKVGPFHNPSETYRYYTLPFCAPDEKKYKSEGLGDVLAGDRAVNTLFDIRFGQDMLNQTLCSRHLNAKQVQEFRRAVASEYYFQMYFDSLPIWGFVGKVEKVDRSMKEHIFTFYLFTHFHFDIQYNGDRVIGIDSSADPRTVQDISYDGDQDVTFTYSVKWTPTHTKFEKRMDKYVRQSFLPQHLEIHWFSIINSSVLVLLLLGILVTIFMRVLKHDFARFSHDDELGDETEETGWKYVHGDVFRLPQNINLLSAILGTGTQILVLTFSVFGLALLGTYNPTKRGAIMASSIFMYALTASVAGYTAGYYYKMFGGVKWVRNVLLTSMLFIGPLTAVFAVLNTVAIAYRSTQALPFGTIALMVFMWCIVTFPSTILGGIIAKNRQVTFDAPCRTTKYPREIPPLPWYRGTAAQMVVAGFLPFSAIYIELYYIFTSVWGHMDYTIYSVLFVVFCILLVVTATITVVLTYFQLAVEDHRWWWRSMLCGGSTSLFVLAYCVYFHVARSGFSSFLQLSRYYGYMALVCYALFHMLATVGFTASMAFVRLIYRSIKSD